MEYREAVTEAKRLIKRSEEDQWRLAQLTWEQTKRGSKTLREWGSDIGVSYGHAAKLSQIWDRWHVFDEHNRPPFRQAYEDLQYGVLDEDKGTASEERAKNTVRNLPPEQKSALAAELIESDPTTRKAVKTAVRDEILEEHFKAPELRPRQKEWDNAYGEESRQIEEERAGHTAMLDFSLYASRLLRFETQDLLTHADLTELQIWEGDLDRLIPMLLALREEIKTRLSRKVKVV